LKTAVIAIIAVVAATVPATASAAYNMTEFGAGARARDVAHRFYPDVTDLAHEPLCRPQGMSYAQFAKSTVRRYHKWICLWQGSLDGEDVWGKLLIVGSRTPGRYYYAVLRGLRHGAGPLYP
jgi:hypothetical protein